MYFSHKYCGSSWGGGGVPTPTPPAAPTIHSRDTEESWGPSSQFWRAAGAGRGGAERPPGPARRGAEERGGAGQRGPRACPQGCRGSAKPESRALIRSSSRERGRSLPFLCPRPPAPSGQQTTGRHSWDSLFIDQTLGGCERCGSCAPLPATGWPNILPCTWGATTHIAGGACLRGWPYRPEDSSQLWGRPHSLPSATAQGPPPKKWPGSSPGQTEVGAEPGR